MYVYGGRVGGGGGDGDGDGGLGGIRGYGMEKMRRGVRRRCAVQ